MGLAWGKRPDRSVTEPVGESRWGALQPLLIPNYRFFLAATVPWNIGRWTETVVASYLMYQLTNSAWEVALLGFCRSAGLPLVGPFAGVIADRFDRLNLVRLCQAINVVTLIAVTALLWTGNLVPWHLLAGSLLIGLSWGLDWPARRAMMVDIVGTPSLVQATVLDNLSMNVSKIIGPAIAGLLLSLLGPLAGFQMLTVAFAGAAVLFLFVRRPDGAPIRITGSPWRNLASGLTYVGRNPAIMGVLIITVLMNCLIFPAIQLLPIVSEEVLQVGPRELGWLAAADGIGALIALPLIARMRGGGPHGWAYIIGSSLHALSQALFAICPWYWPALLLMIIGGIGHAGFGTMQGTIILSRTSPEMRGRVLGVLTLAIGSSPIGALVMGQLAAQGGAAFSIGLCALVALATVIATAMIYPALRQAGRSTAPVPAD